MAHMILRHTLSPALLWRGALRLSSRTRVVARVTSRVQRVSALPSSKFYSAEPEGVAIRSINDVAEEPVRAEHAVISTFDLFSIGGKHGIM